MTTRAQRLAQFDGQGTPPAGEPVEVLCEDKSGTYQLPFPCRWIGSGWENCDSGQALEATVVGWRRPSDTDARED
ncbi:conserved hypothetical protein [Afipia carboxidovorans OM5]|uniref:Uncharacterized protein n=1 Tax=Afipia carboxidovorans (strain ATCC 49405 / DSM 1227 / KCTC 32145 / OM5) TaxID=504832 RepID=B6JF88_AFIC5|nr:hypothetical protein [Afipia carboxidovorans]ACI93307.1 conserved hypothetical protein [Afipia carboxidovorans OM5]AEI02975.1 hypothetical protein OCA4_c18380 [Afipia carboxidovorans OM4]AEI06551.1 hypothetical protein OCA5_c18380 [Afipia carboxidovorans OM5]BEV47424.1 hypothetical protein CRBSH125_36070 [Afipia carboxidovorans]